MVDEERELNAGMKWNCHEEKNIQRYLQEGEEKLEEKYQRKSKEVKRKVRE